METWDEELGVSLETLGYRVLPTVEVEGLDADVLGALDLLEDSGHGQAALLPGNHLARGLDDLRVDQGDQAVHLGAVGCARLAG